MSAPKYPPVDVGALSARPEGVRQASLVAALFAVANEAARIADAIDGQTTRAPDALNATDALNAINDVLHGAYEKGWGEP